jgi:hypothetical membrane protein
LERRIAIGILGPLISIVCVLLAIVVAPAFDWGTDALSDLGHWFRTDIGSNPILRASIFNFGLIIGGSMVVYYMASLIRQTTDLPSKIGYLGPTTVGVFIAGVGVFSENLALGHLITALGYFFSIPISAAIVGLVWLRVKEVRIYGVLCLILALIATILFRPWTSLAIWEYAMAIVSSIELWFIALLDMQGYLNVLKAQ